MGPRPFRSDETLFGREREIVELDRLLSAERIVLLHSPSGAGKSSLVNAGLLPRLDWYRALERGEPLAGRFDVWPPTRVNLPLPSGYAVGNRYAFSAAAGLEQEVPDPFARTPEQLAPLSLKEAVAGRRRRKGAPPSILLIFDQLEEILRVDPLDIPGKEVFFDQLGEVLHDPLVWALLVLREDYLAALDPYCRRVPTHLRNRYRIDRLTPEAAIQAVAGPTAQTPRQYAPGVVERLVEDLAQVQVQQPDGSFRQQTGRHVEPMHLQVVCVGLWDAMAPDDLTVDLEDLASYGDVGEALGRYYDAALGRLADGSEGRERRVREWFEEDLITPDGVRGQVRKGVETSAGLANSDIALLLDTYLVRAEQRAGAIWYELAHDRLIRPIRESNRRWLGAHLSDLQRRAVLWDKGERPDGLLLRDDALREAEVWAGRHANELTETERELVRRSLLAAAAERKALLQARRIKRLAILAVVACAGAIGFSAVAVLKQREALEQKWEAVRQAERARRGLFNAQLARGREVLQRNPAGAQWWLEETGRFPPDLRQHDPIWAALHTAARLSNPGKGRVVETRVGGVFGIALSDDGSRLASLGSDGTIKVWSVADWSLLGQIPGQGRQVNGLAFIAGGRHLATVSADGSLDLWDPRSGAPIAQWAGPAVGEGPGALAGLNALAPTPDGRTLACAGDDGGIALLDARTGKAIRTPLKGHAGAVRALSVSPDGRALASAGDDGSVRIWDLASGALKATLTGHTGLVHGVAFAPDGRSLASAGGDATVRVWSPAGGASLAVLSGHIGEVTELVYAPDGRLLVTGDTDGNVILWDPGRGESQAVLRGHEGPILGLAFAGGGDTLASAGRDGTLRLWTMERAKDMAGTLSGHAAPVYGVAFASGGRLLASAGWDGTVRLWDTRTGEPQGPPLRGDLLAAYSVAFAPDGRTVAVGGLEGTVKLVNVASWRIDALLKAHKAPVVRLAYDEDGTTLASAGGDGQVVLWDPAAGGARLTLDAHKERASGLAFSPRGVALATGGWDGTLKLWSARDGTLLRTFDPGAGRLEAVAFSPDGRTVAVAAWDGAIYRFDVGSGNALPRLAGHADRAMGLAYSPDGAWLASAGEDGTANLWDPATGEVRRTLAEHTDWVADLAFSPDSRTLATASWDRSIKLWTVPLPEPSPPSVPPGVPDPGPSLASMDSLSLGALLGALVDALNGGPPEPIRPDGPNTGPTSPRATDVPPYLFAAPEPSFRLTAAHLEEAGVDPGRAEQWVDPLNRTMDRYRIDTPLRRAHFLATVLHESTGLWILEERFGYSAAKLTQVFPRYFPSREEARAFAGKPERIANRIYANRLGNGDEASGDGWRYRGRGAIFFTGKDNYRALSQGLGVDLVANPDLVATEHATDSAGFYWESRNLNALADQDDVRSVTRRVNGGLNGLQERKALTERLKEILAQPQRAADP